MTIHFFGGGLMILSSNKKTLHIPSPHQTKLPNILSLPNPNKSPNPPHAPKKRNILHTLRIQKDLPMEVFLPV